MLSQVLLVGVGGSGGKTLRVLRQTLLRRLRTAGWTSDELPDAWQMLWVDTVSGMSADGFPEKLLPQSDYLGLVSHGMNWSGTLSALTNSLSIEDRQRALASWVPTSVPIDITNGAGQFRAIGRGVALNRLDAITGKLKEKYQIMTAPKAMSELAEVARLLGSETEAAARPPFAMVISSMAGGSGAGMFIDVAEALKTVGPSFAAKTHTIMYGPDVFGSLPAGMSNGVAPNVLAALNEITSCVRKESMDVGSKALFASHGSDVKTGEYGIGGRYLYLIGARNGKIAFGNQEDVYRAVGEALAPMVIDDVVQEWLNAFVLTNVFDASGAIVTVEDETQLRDSSNVQHRQPLSSLGFGRVGLGMDRFGEYAAEVLAKETIDRLLWPRGVPMDPREPKTEAEHIVERLDNTWLEFLNKSGLNERDPANDVVDALVPADSAQRFQTAAVEMVQRAGGNAGQAGLDPQTWFHQLTVEYTNGLPAVLARETDERYVCAREWAKGIQEHLVGHITDAVSKHGLKVAAKLIEKLRVEAREVATGELATQASRELSYLDAMSGGIQSRLNTGLTAIPVNHPVIDEVRNLLVKGMELNANSSRFELASKLLLDLDDNLLQVLQRAVAESAAALESDVSATGADGAPSPYVTWPDMDDTVIPNRLIPGVTERVLVEASEYQGLLATLAQQSVGRAHSGAWEQRLVSRTVSGLPLDERGDTALPNLITMRPSWNPLDDRVRWEANTSAQRAGAKIPTDASLYVDRARETIVDDDVTILGKFIKQDLESYLKTPDVSEAANREAKFAAALGAALQASGPMADIRPDLLGLVHPKQTVSSYMSASTLPRSLKSLIDPVLDKAQTDRSGIKYGDVRPQQLDFFQVTHKAYHPVVFRTLMDPIASSWGEARTNAALRESWWQMRRGRPLTEAIPATDDVILQMITGWFVAGIMGIRRTTTPNSSGGPMVEVADERGQWLAFPHPLLGFRKGDSDHEILPSVLKSLGIAIAQVGVSSPASLDALEPYWRLRDMGENAAAVISQWVRTGATPSQGILPNPSTAASPAEPAEVRREALLKSVALARATVEKIFAGVESNPNELNTQRIWELRVQILAALQVIHDSVSRADVTEDTTGIL
ncbi:MAG: hypothetical protein NTZ03_02235 [Actinobacteria bacterium]|nr:hypothetical protein [Actinomycetota bacterium]